MSAPLKKSSGAPAAQTGCATGGPDTTYTRQRRKARHCAFASGAAQQADRAYLASGHLAGSATNGGYQAMTNEEIQSKAKRYYLEALKAELVRVADELYEHDISAMRILSDHIRSKLRRDAKTGRMMKADIK